jgi:hypothetical protein
LSEEPGLDSDIGKDLENESNVPKSAERLESFSSSSSMGSKRSAKRKPTTKKAKYDVHEIEPEKKVPRNSVSSPNDPFETALPSENSTPSRSFQSTSISSTENSNGKVILDLTQPIEVERKTFSRMPNRMPVAISRDTSFNIPHSLGQEDIMVGCSALLSLGWHS